MDVLVDLPLEGVVFDEVVATAGMVGGAFFCFLVEVEGAGLDVSIPPPSTGSRGVGSSLLPEVTPRLRLFVIWLGYPSYQLRIPLSEIGCTFVRVAGIRDLSPGAIRVSRTLGIR